MEREFESEPKPALALVESVSIYSKPDFRMAQLFVVMLLPWLWVSLGLTGLKNYALTILLYELLGCGVPILLYRGKSLKAWSLSLPYRDVWLMIVSTNLLILGLFKLTHGFGIEWVCFARQAKAVQLEIKPLFWFFCSFIVVLNPLFEEHFWRGVVFEEWKRYVSPLKAALISSFFFGAWHWLVLRHFCQPGWAIFLSVAVMCGGVIFALLYERNRTLSASVLLHGLGADFPMVFVAYACLQNSAGFAG